MEGQPFTKSLPHIPAALYFWGRERLGFVKYFPGWGNYLKILLFRLLSGKLSFILLWWHRRGSARLTFSRGEGGPPKAGRKRNSGKNPKCGTGKDLLTCCVRLSLFLRTSFNISARIPLQPQCAHWGSFPPGGRLWCAKRSFTAPVGSR